jgi:chromosome segregation ATPase
VLYLAEVKKQTKLFMGRTRTVLNLLACQQNDHRWSAMPKEETISTEEITQQFAEGALVTVNLGSNRQVQGKVEWAGKKVAQLLQTFSRQVEKTKGQEEEIEHWKQSLTYQSQELSRRQSQLQQAEEEVARKEEELSQLEEERQEIQQLREEWERDRAGLEGAWEHIQGEQQRLERQQEQLQQHSTPQPPPSVQGLIEQVESAIAIAQNTINPLQTAQNLIDQQKETLQNHRETLEQQSQQAQAKQEEADQYQQQLKFLRQQQQEKQANLLKTQQRLATVRGQLDIQQQIVTNLKTQLQKQSEARDLLSRLVINSPQLKIQQESNFQSLDSMPIEQLKTQIQALQNSFEEAISFVKDQEEELDHQLQTIRELEKEIKQNDTRESEEMKNKELAEEQDRYRFLEETLLGQRKTLMARENRLENYQATLKRLQGDTHSKQLASKVDLSQIFNQIDTQQNNSEDKLEQVNEEIETLQTELAELESIFQQEQQDYENQRIEIANLERSWQKAETEASNLLNHVEINSDAFIDQQESFLNSVREHLELATNQFQQLTLEEEQEKLSQAKQWLNQKPNGDQLPVTSDQ